MVKKGEHLFLFNELYRVEKTKTKGVHFLQKNQVLLYYECAKRNEEPI